MGEIIGFSGSSRPLPEAQRAAVFSVLSRLRAAGAEWLHHGDCINADAAAHDIWRRELGGLVEVHPGDSRAARAYCVGDIINEPLPYLERNGVVAARTTVLVAAPARAVEELRSGTWATVRYARRRGSRVLVVGPDGDVREHRAEGDQLRMPV